MADEVPGWDAVLSPRASWALLIVARESEMDDFVRRLPSRSRATARILRGGRCATKQALFQEWAAALQFPDYFGHNWDAFEECLASREWLPGGVHVAILTNAGRVLEDQSKELPTFLRILKAVAEEPVGPRLRVLFQCDAADVADLRGKLGEEDIRV